MPPAVDCDVCHGQGSDCFSTNDEPKEQPVPKELETYSQAQKKAALARHERDLVLDHVEVDFTLTKLELLQVARFWMKKAFNEGAFCHELGIPSWQRDLHPNERVELISTILGDEILNEAWQEVEKEFDESENDPIERARRTMLTLVDEVKTLVEQFGKPPTSGQRDCPSGAQE